MATANPISNFVDKVKLEFGQDPVGEEVDQPIWMPMYQGLIDRGMTPTVASSAVANMGAESGFDPAAFNEAGGGQGALGLAQWRGSRQSALKALAAERGVDPTDMETQLDFMVQELGGDEAATIKALENITSPNMAARIFRDRYERPGGHGYESTGNYADEIATYLGSEENAAEFAANEKIGGGKLLRFADDAGDKANGIAAMMFPGEEDTGDLAMGTKALPPRPISPQATRDAGPSAGVSGLPPSDSPAAVDGVESEGGREGIGGLIDKFSSTLFPNQEDATGELQRMMGGIGVGLSQMSHGEAVNLQPYFQNIQNQKNTILQAKAAHEQQAIDNDFRDRAISVQEGQLGNAGRKLALDSANAVQTMQPGGGVFTPEQMATIQANPNTQHLVPQLGSSDPAIYKQAMKDYNKIIGDNLDTTDKTGSMSNLHRVASDPNSTPEQMSAALEGMDNSDVDTVFRMPGLKDNKTALMRNTDHIRELAKTDPDAAAAFEKALRIQSGLSEVDEQTLDMGFDKMNQYGTSASNASKIQPTLVSLRSVSDDIIRQGGNTSAISDVLGKMQGVAVGMGFHDVDDFLAKNFTGATADQLQNMNQGTKILAFELGRQWLEGQGSVSDGERKQLVEGLLSGTTTSAQRSRALSRLEVMGEADTIVYEEFMKHAGDNFEHTIRSEKRIVSIAKPAISAISTAVTASDLYARSRGLLAAGDKSRQADVDLGNRLDVKNKGTDDYNEAVKERAMLRAPHLSPEQATMFSSLLKKRKISHYFDPKTSSLVPIPN